jgi:hypothetical protein
MTADSPMLTRTLPPTLHLARRHRRAHVALLALLAALAVLVMDPTLSGAATCTLNPVACENQNTGDDPGTWQIEGIGDPSIQGFATQQSVTPGQTINFKIKSASNNYKIDILRLGYYNGKGARRWATNLSPTGSSTNQPACNTYSDSGLVDCGNWSMSGSWAVPTNAVSGVYIAYLHLATGGASHIIFVVRNDTSHSDIVYQTSDATWQAYNTYGGNSLYQCTVSCPPGDPAAYKAAYKVSYNRPNTAAEDDYGRSAMFTGAEYPMIRYLERNGYDVSYTSQLDTEARGSLIKNHKIFVSSGHDEYDSATQRANIEAARDAGTNLAFFSGNELFWKTRYEGDPAGTATRVLVAYKDTHFASQQDPVAWTGTWRDNRWASAGDNVRPENALTGQSFTVNAGTAAITVPSIFRSLRIWKNTEIASLTGSNSVTLAPGTLGYEWDEDIDNGFRPAGEFHLSSTTATGLELFTDYGSTTQTGGTATHMMSLYKAPSGALVFGAGTVQFAWGLDSENENGNDEDDNMQQMVVNLFADMGVQPATRMSTLVAASKSTDTTAPHSTITSLPSTVADGTSVTISGTATDVGGVVAGVEVSTDGGSTWHPANGSATWSYSWIAHGNPSTTVKTRAVDDSGNIETPGSGSSVSVTCPCSLWGPNVTPPAASVDAGDPTPVEVGMKFKSDTFGQITGVRFYKAAANSGTHVGSVWTTDGQRLAEATFTSETASGWQSVTFDTPVQVLPGTTYVVSYFAPNGHYSATSDYFYRTPSPGPSGGSKADSAPLHAIRSGGTSGSTTTNGLFAYTPTSGFPTGSFVATNYWVDVRFSPIPAPGQVADAAAVEAGRTSANVTWSAPSTGGAPTSYKVTPYIGTTAQTPVTVNAPATAKTITGLTTGTTYTFTVQAGNPTGSGPASAPSNAVTPSVPVVPTAPSDVSARPATRSALVSWSVPSSDGDSAITGYRVTPYIGSSAQTPVTVSASSTSTTVTGLTNGTSYTFKVQATNAVGTGPASAASRAVVPQSTIFDFHTPADVDSGEAIPIEVGMKFKADYNGTITGGRFYKAATNTGIHTGSLWTAGGSRLGQVTFTGESATGWQTATFATPISVTAGTTYVVSYFAPSGHYSDDVGALLNGADNGALHAIANSTSANGVYAYGSTSTFPSNAYNATSYGVDVLYALPVPGTVTGVSAAASGSSAATVTWNAPASGGPATTFRITPYVNGSAQSPTTVDTAGTGRVTGLTTGTTYTFTVTALNANGAGPASAQSNAVTPSGPVVPGAPTGVTARPATRSAEVSWSAPASDGDSAITGYTVTPFAGSTAGTPVTVGGGTTSTTVTGLDNGTAYTFTVKATNGIGTGPASAASSAVTPEATIFDFATPDTVDSGDPNGVELGAKFKTDVGGSATGVRFYKAAGNTGTHTGSLWTAGGSRLAQVTFTGETDSGWQSATFASRVTLTANTTYVVSYFAPNGHYSVTSGGLLNGKDNAVLHALADASSPNGVFAYGPASTFPAGSYNAGDYGVDVLFDPPKAPGTPSGVTATAGAGTATVSWTAPSSGGAPTSYKITPFVGTSAQTATTITGTPPATSKTITGLTPGTAYTFTVTAANSSGSGPESANSAAVTPTGANVPGAPTAVAATTDTKSATVSWTAPASDGGTAITGYTVTPATSAGPQTPTSVSDGSATSTHVTGLTNGTSYTFTVKATNASGTGAASSASNAIVPQNSLLEFGTPATVDSGDGNGVNLGLKFTADRDGSVAGARFYKAAANTGAHVASLWTSDGTLIRESTFSGESGSGWQTVLFSSPAPITAGTTYVISYFAPNGHYSVDGWAFATSLDNPPLHALDYLTSPNGIYQYGGAAGFPTNSWNASNYWVDVLFN